ncbi:similar to Saccharomyces cerevisiae YLR240W VPS34 Phosphatidylinositol 3-kinase responsible for the synthesis of phosphatidylinositol 3- phosphate [Maudiozyma barnettii]|nr:similar to Saccharomyces cerevisiae YLR240W VPS34 Phosphatidylinositol 3-kinase responsible for the synthesis of phosphatidylinositol 3- phosphate [Kazachstania barnettii]
MSSTSVAFCISQDLDIPLRIKIISLDGHRKLVRVSERLLDPKLSLLESNVGSMSNLIVSVEVFDSERGRNMTIPVFTPYIPFKTSRLWEHWLTLPITIKDLNLNSTLRIVLWEYNGVKRIPFCNLETNIFQKSDCSLKRGFESLKFEYKKNDKQYFNEVTIEESEIQKNLNKFYQGEVKKIHWLDQISLKKLKLEEKYVSFPQDTFLLNIEYPFFELPIVFTEKIARDTQRNIPTLHNFETTNDPLNNQNIITDTKISLGSPSNSTLKFYDPDQYNSDPIEEKYRRLERASKNSDLDKHLKPDTNKRKQLNQIIQYPPGTKLTGHEKGSVWRYRYYLINNKKALTKLLQSTNFNEENERTEVLELMNSWAEIDIDDAIELLSPSFTDLWVRSYAVNRLKKASDKELELYLLQLVQAVCFENKSTPFNNSDYSEYQIINNSVVASSRLTQKHQKLLTSINGMDDDISEIDEGIIVISPLSEFLIRRALKNIRLGTFFYWYIFTECKDKPYLKQILESFHSRLSDNSLQILKNQIELIKLLGKCCTDIKKLKETTEKKSEFLNQLLTTKFRHWLKKRGPIVLPLDPSVQIIEVVPELSKVFKSSLSPLMITFKTTDNDDYSLMYKVGDDLRQDQLVIQIIRLMDELLKNENVDLKLSPYKILATGPDEGSIQFIPNETMTNILSKYHGILGFLRRHHPSETDNLGVEASVVDTFVKSCAGYCVITYVLGVGDRHLDNLLVTPDGHFFHADFGYILGQDPKPFPPLMKLPPQIIEAFGGAESPNYDKFRNYCFVAYSILRRNAGLILNLFELMKTSSIPDIRIDPDGAILKVKERFNLDMSEEEATLHFQNLINDSVNALMPIVIDHLHNFAQYWRT